MQIQQYNFESQLPEPFVIALAVVENISLSNTSEILDQRLNELLIKRSSDLSEQEDQKRQSVRKLLRNGKYRPTGRSKPAAEYLLRSAAQNKFPRINLGVDLINYLSLKYLLPISLWDLDLATSSDFVFRYGESEEKYIFNQADQTIDLEDLVCGCSQEEDKTIPIVNPVKDSLRTKTIPETKNIAMAIYTSFEISSKEELNDLLTEFREILSPFTSAVASNILPS